MREIHLISNAHIDPVWQWEWEEGAAAAVSSFRAAADFLDEFDDYIFCHNEALLYKWVEEYEPALFSRIQAHVKSGRWRIMGGWYLQSDCNMPSGESIIRQMQQGKSYFKEKFNSANTTAVSFDAFGHNRGLVQLLKKAGYDSYLFMRPGAGDLPLEKDDFLWVGFDGSEIMAHRINTGYNSPLGEAKNKIEKWLNDHEDTKLGMIPWGVGNHGGGPSRKDIQEINEFKNAHPQYGIRHSTPEEYFSSLSKHRASLPSVARSLQPWAVGCYTSQIRIKQQHRNLEGLLNSTERMLSHAYMAQLISYPKDEMNQATQDLCMSEFHDILPGSSIQAVEETSLQIISHAKEIASRLRARAFYALAAREKKAAPGEYPVLVYNPFPYEIETDVECEFMLQDQNWKEEFTDMAVYEGETRLASQIEKERSNLPLDWRKRVVFRAKLKPMQMNRFSCFANVLPEKPKPLMKEENGAFVFENGEISVEIDTATGLLRKYARNGIDYLKDSAMKLLVVDDSCDPWGMTVDRFRGEAHEFRLMTEEESARFAGVSAPCLRSVRAVEDGPVRTVVEASFIYKNSFALITYRLPKTGAGISVVLRLQFAEKDKMVKLSLPTVLTENYVGQEIFGTEELFTDGRENVSQQWTAAKCGGYMFTVINDGVYGSDFKDGEIRISLLRSAGFTAHPINDRPILPQDRFSPRIDQGERMYSFVIQGGDECERTANVTREALRVNEPPYALSFFPNGNGDTVQSAALLSEGSVVLTCLRPSDDGSGFVARLFESAGKHTSAQLALPLLHSSISAKFSPYEVKTFRIDPASGTAGEADILS
ncbi:MAG: alpha-mannosidase [Clostridia bacterium]|nr:alpha-mannosidase [Clostridia bacterium]